MLQKISAEVISEEESKLKYRADKMLPKQQNIFDRVKDRSRQLREPLYMVRAQDEAVRVEDAPKILEGLI